ncbi:winged helix-turn-helix domain-containing protein [Paracoccus aminophilus]|nr:LysR family transcriptional regulator [Paracoccus aminophilus]
MSDDPRLSLRLHFAQGLTFGRGKADLLQAIADEGSISAAGRAMDMSYRRAWALVEEMNLAFTEPLVDSARGGSGGGGAHLTARGEQVLRDYRALEAVLRHQGEPHLASLRAGLKPAPPAPEASADDAPQTASQTAPQTVVSGEK